MQKITDNGKTLAIIYRSDEWKEGLDFITPNELFIQAGTWSYNKGKKLASHIHKENIRTANITQELVFVKQGSLKVLLFDENRKLKQEFILKCGDIAVMVSGGHGYEILEDTTQVLEVKNGPFIDVDRDKEKF